MKQGFQKPYRVIVATWNKWSGSTARSLHIRLRHIRGRNSICIPHSLSIMSFSPTNPKSTSATPSNDSKSKLVGLDPAKSDGTVHSASTNTKVNLSYVFSGRLGDMGSTVYQGHGILLSNKGVASE